MGFFLPILASALVIGIAYTSWIILYQYTYWKCRKMLHLKPVPVIGNNAPFFFRNVAFPYHIQNLYENFPGAKYYGIFDFKNPVLLLKDPEMIRDVCIKSFESYVDHDAFVTEEMDPIVGRNLFSLRGQRWKDVRSTLSPSFTTARMRIMFQLIAECSDDFVQYFLDNPEVSCPMNAFCD
ncbi:cytochrome P450 9e2-like [Copidosoma floridanum]|uniref:cytochrome P450 9e2-like n=1 Tax=Copidosoma floridanum TaxID=29053 RepID=UPI0006C97CDE|nr:cytochrome P450 9e2-like [Copidosoma floridanum]